MKELLKAFREKLAENGQSLIWWHSRYAEKNCKYNYFIRQINIPGALKSDLAEIIERYIEE